MISFCNATYAHHLGTCQSESRRIRRIEASILCGAVYAWIPENMQSEEIV